MKLKLVPTWVKDYDRSWAPLDLVAGLTVGALVVPEGMSYAQLAGVPCVCVGKTVAEPRLGIAAQHGDAAAIDESLDKLKAAWQRPLNW